MRELGIQGYGKIQDHCGIQGGWELKREGFSNVLSCTLLLEHHSLGRRTVHTHTHTHSHTHTHAPTHARTHAHTHARTHTRTHAHMRFQHDVKIEAVLACLGLLETVGEVSVSASLVFELHRGNQSQSSFTRPGNQDDWVRLVLRQQEPGSFHTLQIPGEGNSG